jgi:hypothetical protein
MKPEPYAFPGVAIDPDYRGMTLRDWFATHAPPAPVTWWAGGIPDCAAWALWNYQYADAMMAARATEDPE